MLKPNTARAARNADPGTACRATAPCEWEPQISARNLAMGVTRPEPADWRCWTSGALLTQTGDCELKGDQGRRETERENR
jgi:hypothetical protein